MNDAIAKRYTQALFELCQEQNTCEQVRHDLKEISALIDESEELLDFLYNPVIDFDLRQGIIKKIFKNQTNTLTYQFISFLNSKNRLNVLKEICPIFESVCLNATGVSKVTVTSSIILNKGQLQDISKQLKSRLKKEIEAQFVIDPAMLGGIKIQDGDTIYDYSLRTQLEQFRKNLMKA